MFSRRPTNAFEFMEGSRYEALLLPAGVRWSVRKRVLRSTSKTPIAVQSLSPLHRPSTISPERPHDEITADYTDMIYAATPQDVADRRKAFIRKSPACSSCFSTSAAPPTRRRRPMNKIAPDHLTRSAFVYVRQSTPDQLTNDPESRRRQ